MVVAIDDEGTDPDQRAWLVAPDHIDVWVRDACNLVPAHRLLIHDVEACVRGGVRFPEGALTRSGVGPEVQVRVGEQRRPELQ
jgi:hypothetical protein